MKTQNVLRHIAIIMDGNGRWADRQGIDRIEGHKEGVVALRKLIEADIFTNPQIEVCTLFAFSSENWRRSQDEIDNIMSLFVSSLRTSKDVLIKNNLRLRIIGSRSKLDKQLCHAIDTVEKDTASGEKWLVFALDYGGRWDIVKATKQIAEQVSLGKIKVNEISEELFAQYIAISDLPAPDLLIRTGYEQRISNFMLWQLAYSELYFADCYWPDFDKTHLRNAIEYYSSCQRRFGDVTT